MRISDWSSDVCSSDLVFSELGRLRAFKEERADEGAGMLLAVAGCVAQAEGDEILRRAPQVDIVFGPQTYHRLPALVARAAPAGAQREGGGRGVLDLDFPAEVQFDLFAGVDGAPATGACVAAEAGWSTS